MQSSRFRERRSHCGGRPAFPFAIFLTNLACTKVDCFISEPVIQEAGRGDQEAAQKRLAVTVGIPTLILNEAIKELALKYQAAAKIPEKAKLDAFHLALPAWYKVDYLLTWNCKHIANGNVRKIIENINKPLNIHTPIICTPEELMEVERYVE